MEMLLLWNVKFLHRRNLLIFDGKSLEKYVECLADYKIKKFNILLILYYIYIIFMIKIIV